MLTIKETKELIKDRNISDEETKKVRDACYQLADLVKNKYLADKKKGLSK